VIVIVDVTIVKVKIVVYDFLYFCTLHVIACHRVCMCASFKVIINRMKYIKCQYYLAVPLAKQ